MISSKYIDYIVAVLVFHIVEFYNSHHPDPHDPDGDRTPDDEHFPDGMFRFEKKMR